MRLLLGLIFLIVAASAWPAEAQVKLAKDEVVAALVGKNAGFSNGDIMRLSPDGSFLFTSANGAALSNTT
jgi:hypothetical protein